MNAIDIFAGAGGFSLAANNLDIKVIAAIEFDRHACNTYRTNFIVGKSNPPLLFEDDITKLDPNTVKLDCSLRPKELDLLMGGPPCQGFSKHRYKNTGVNDPRNTLLLKYFDYVRELKPKCFIIENVPGMLWPRHSKYLKKLYRLAKKEGYHIAKPVFINARDFGVPQNRKRVFIFGCLTEYALNFSWPPEPTHFNPKSKEVLKINKPKWVNASTVFSKKLAKNDVNDLHMNHTDELVNVFKSTPINGGSREQSNRILPCHEKGYLGHKDVYGRIDPSKPGPTMTTACVNPSKGRFVHPIKHHGITIRHAARFQTFPDWFVFKGGLTAAGVQVGNAVPINLGEVVLKTVQTGLKDHISNNLIKGTSKYNAIYGGVPLT